MSPALFAVYLDDLILELRSYGLGCHMAGLWMGAVGFADDLLLMAPSRSAMAKMLEVCEKYAMELNLVFSTDPDPKKSKSKSIFMTGARLRHVSKPVNLQLYGQDLDGYPLQHISAMSCTRMVIWIMIANAREPDLLIAAQASEKPSNLPRRNNC